MGGSVLFVAMPRWKRAIVPARGWRIWRDLDSIEEWAPDWREVPVSKDLRNLEGIAVRRFQLSSNL